MLKPDVYKQYKKNAVAKASDDVKNFVSNNEGILQDIVDNLCAALAARQMDNAGKLSYQVSNMAPLYHRRDLANMANFLCQILKNSDFNEIDGIYDLFENNFHELNQQNAVDPDLEQKILANTRNRLVALQT